MLSTVNRAKKAFFLDCKAMFSSGLRECGKKSEILMKKYLIARNTLPTFCDLLNKRHVSVLV